MNHLYENEARKRWGDTGAYKESERRTADYDLADWSELSAGMDAFMAGFAELKGSGAAPGDEPARLQVEQLKQFITDKMYTCTDEILSGLGQSPTNASRRTSTSTAKARLSMSARASRATADNKSLDHKGELS